MSKSYSHFFWTRSTSLVSSIAMDDRQLTHTHTQYNYIHFHYSIKNVKSFTNYFKFLTCPNRVLNSSKWNELIDLPSQNCHTELKNLVHIVYIIVGWIMNSNNTFTNYPATNLLLIHTGKKIKLPYDINTLQPSPLPSPVILYLS